MRKINDVHGSCIEQQGSCISCENKEKKVMLLLALDLQKLIIHERISYDMCLVHTHNTDG